ncbi:MAG: pyridoxamine 5'-phosphate oxidase family protein [Chloroflexi bacterium]|nr:pyridoxamine 5'-phosphate oxidase family protein [Chloroflexota bacterium]
MTTTDVANADALQKLRDLTSGIHVAMLTTVEEDGSLRSRPMGTQALDQDGCYWLFTEAAADKVGDVQHDQQVNLAYSHPSDRWVSVSGTATLVRDAAKQRELWNTFVQAWFPGGPDDPSVALLRVQVSSAEYWESPGGKVVQLFKLMRSAMTHKPPTDIGKSETLTVHGST